MMINGYYIFFSYTQQNMAIGEPFLEFTRVGPFGLPLALENNHTGSNKKSWSDIVVPEESQLGRDTVHVRYSTKVIAQRAMSALLQS